MKLNNRGWGTTEMLLLSGGLLIALFVSAFFISKFYGSIEKSMDNRYYFDLETSLESAAKNYVEKNNININGDYKINIETLKNSGEIKSLKDLDGKTCTGYVRVTTLDNNDYYNAYISCPNYETQKY